MKWVATTTRTFAVSIFFTAVFYIASNAQVPKPEIGKQMPDYTFNYVKHYKNKSVSISDFRGKWLFLDFWANACGSCITSFSEVNKFQKEFHDTTVWLLVGRNSLQSQTDHKAGERMYEKFANKYKYDLITAYDSVLFSDWDIPFVPYLLVIDPQGILKYIIASNALSAERIRGLIKGEHVDFHDVTKDLLRYGPSDYIRNGKLIYSSLVTGWNGEGRQTFSIFDFALNTSKMKGYEVARYSLTELYMTAYFGKNKFNTSWDTLHGKIYSYPVLDLKDSSLFISDFGLGTGLYNYFLRLPPEQVTLESVMAQMQDDLHRIFGYRVSVEVRDVSIWKLISTPVTEQKVKSRGGLPYNSTKERVYAGGFWTRNIPFKEFYWTLTSYLSIADRDVFIDETGISSNVDISLEADLTDLKDLQRALKKYDLQFVRASVPMKVLVIKDHGL